MIPSLDDIVRRAAHELFSRPLLMNIHRAAIVEAIVASALEPEWKWCSADYSSCDLRRVSGLRLEVKQSASLQSWNEESRRPSKCSFDIAEKTGEWVDGGTSVEGAGRNAEIYLFCHHPLTSDEADHRNPAQWLFFIVLAAKLPPQKTIGLKAVEALAESVSYSELAATVKRTVEATLND